MTRQKSDQTQLFIVPTPIGNLSDITIRALEVLKSVDIILAEDTRRSRILLDRFSIPVPPEGIHSFYKDNEARRLPQVKKWLSEGKKIAYITDSGTPAIADPGYTLIRLCISGGFKFTVLPGPTAFLPAILLSGIPPDKFAFAGFFPRKKRSAIVEWIKAASVPVIFYEAPTRIAKTMLFLADQLGNDWYGAVICEISKIHERVYKGKLGDLGRQLLEQGVKGECVLIVVPPHIAEKVPDIWDNSGLS